MKEQTAKTPEVTLRNERPKDYAHIGALLDEAFAGHDEAELVARVRQTPEYINDLTLVATCDDQVVGFIMLSYVTLAGDGIQLQVLSLGPVAVVPPYQRQGIGSKLIEASINLADARGEALIVLLGHAQYYRRFGFERASFHGIYPPVAWPDDSYMVLRLSACTPAARGKIEYPPSWQIA